MLLFAESETLDIDDIPDDVRPNKGAPLPSHSFQNLLEAGAGANASLKDIVKQATYELERDLILKALEETHGNVTRAANLLQISRKGLQNKMKELNVATK